MFFSLKQLAKNTLRKFDIGTLKYSRLLQLEQSSRAADDIQVLLGLPERHAAQLLKTLRDSKSGLRQDLFVLSELDFKSEGFFVEFGATNGIDGSNTYLLEKKFGWNGILAEPARRWQSDLLANRNCSIETNCVWRESGETLEFNEANYGELSTIDSFSSADHRSRDRIQGKKYSVKTISLMDLLEKYRAPSIIDYLSIDTEGSEYEILSSFNFSKYQFRTLTCEHNFTPQRERIHSLLTGHGYRRKYEDISKVDDWYVKA